MIPVAIDLVSTYSPFYRKTGVIYTLTLMVADVTGDICDSEVCTPSATTWRDNHS
jgi:hypothetical protein